MNSTTMDATIKAIANELDARERFVLAWIERHIITPYREVSGDTLDALIMRGLVQVTETDQPQCAWPVTCSELGCEVCKYLRTIKTMAQAVQ